MVLSSFFQAFHRLAGAGLFLFAAAFLVAAAGAPGAMAHGLPFLSGLGLNTALCIGLFGLSLAVTHEDHAPFGVALYALVGAIAATSLMQYALGFYPPDGPWLLLLNTLPAAGEWAGRMSVASAGIVLLFAGGTGLVASRHQAPAPAVYLTLGLGTLLALSSLTAHLAGIVLFDHTRPEAGFMSPASSILLMVAGVAAWMAAENCSGMRDWRAKLPHRDLIVYAIGVLSTLLVIGGVAAGALLLRGQALLATAMVLLLAAIGAALLYWRIVPVFRRMHRAEGVSARWHNIFEHADWGVVVGDANGVKLELMNPAFAHMHGYTVEELEGRSILDVFAPECRAEVAANIQLAHEKGHYIWESWHVRRDGSRFPAQIDVTAVKDEGGNVFYRVVNVQDITDRRLAEDALREREATLVQAQAQANLGSWWLDIPCNVLRWSDENYRIFGVPIGTPLTYETFLGCIHPDDRAYVDAPWHAGMAGAPYDIQHRLLVNGQVKWVRERAELEFHPDGTLWRGVGTTQDITELKLKEEELLHSRQMLRELAAHHEKIREEERSRIAREIHDELGQYLTALRMDAAVVGIRFGKLDPELGLLVRGMKENIDTTIGVVRNVAAALRPGALDMGLVSAAEWLLAGFEERTGILCHLEAPQDDLELDDARATAAFRILQESLTNVARHAHAGQVWIRLARAGHTLSMQVSDDGIGFDPDQVSRQKTFGLMGIRERALMFGGEVRVDSRPGAGTSLSVTIPLGDDSSAPPPEIGTL